MNIIITDRMVLLTKSDFSWINDFLINFHKIFKQGNYKHEIIKIWTGKFSKAWTVSKSIVDDLI